MKASISYHEFGRLARQLLLALAAVAVSCGYAAGMSDTQRDLNCLRGKYNVNHNVAQLHGTTNESDIIVFEFEIPYGRRLYHVSITSNAVSLALHTIGHGDKQEIVAHGVDIELIESFQRELLSYKYEPLSVTSGPRYVYVSNLNTPMQWYKFDFPWWISSCRSDIPKGMLIGVDPCTAKAYQSYSAIFRRYIYPNIMQLQDKRIKSCRQKDNHVSH